MVLDEKLSSHQSYMQFILRGTQITTFFDNLSDSCQHKTRYVNLMVVLEEKSDR